MQPADFLIENATLVATNAAVTVTGQVGDKLRTFAPRQESFEATTRYLDLK